MKTICVLLGLILAPTEPRDHYPPRIRKVLDSRIADTSQVEWTVSWIGGRDDGLVERYVTRQAGDAVWESNLGDAHGHHCTGYRADPVESPEDKSPHDEEWFRTHEIPKEELSGTHNNLIYDRHAWRLEYAERPLTGIVQPLETVTNFLPVKLSAIGLAPCWGTGMEVHPFLLSEWESEGFDSATFGEGIERGQPTLSAVYGGGRSRLTWRFDDRYGGKPVWAGFERDGIPVYYSETEYEQIGERWFPKSVRFYQGDSSSPYKMIDVQRATFDQPWHMQEITPADIGALYGTQFGTPGGVKTWTGAELIPYKEYLDLIELDGVLPDPRILELLAELIGKTVDEYVAMIQRTTERRREEYRKKYGEEPWLVTKSPKEKDEWDLYVENFLVRHKLPEPGVKRANEIRDQAKKLRDGYRRKNAAKLHEAKEEGDQRKIAEYEGIEKRIFDRVLVRELERLVQDEKELSKKEP